MSNSDKCIEQEPIPEQKYADSLADISKALGGNQVCTKSASTVAANASASASASASGYGASFQGNVQASSAFVDNDMAESGCSSLVIATQQVATNTNKIQCILQKSAQTSNNILKAGAVITIKSLELTPQEIRAKNEALQAYGTLKDFQNRYIKEYREIIKENNESIDSMLSVPNLSDARYNALLAQRIIFNSKEATNSATKAYKEGLAAIESFYDRNINLENVELIQKVTVNAKLITKLSSEDSAKLEDCSKQIASAVAQAALEQKSGVNALSPSVKALTDTKISNNQSLSASNINSKVQDSEIDTSVEGKIEIIAAGKINAKNLKFDQNVMLTMVADVILNNAVTAGIKTAAEIASDSKTIVSLKQESKGLDDLIKAQGEANAAAITANISAISGGVGSLLGLIIFFIMLIFPSCSKDKNTFCVPAYVKIGFFVFLLLVIAIISVLFFSTFTRIYREISGTPSDEDLELKLKRPLKFYQQIWNTMGCNKTLTVHDIIDFGVDDEKLSNINAMTLLRSIAQKYKQRKDDIGGYCLYEPITDDLVIITDKNTKGILKIFYEVDKMFYTFPNIQLKNEDLNRPGKLLKLKEDVQVKGVGVDISNIDKAIIKDETGEWKDGVIKSMVYSIYDIQDPTKLLAFYIGNIKNKVDYIFENK